MRNRKPESKLVKIHPEIALAAAVYYINKAKQINVSVVTVGQPPTPTYVATVNRTFKWDKEGDNQKFFDTMEKHGFSDGSGICGTFWFYKGRYIYEMSEVTWPLAKRTLVPKTSRQLP